VFQNAQRLIYQPLATIKMKEINEDNIKEINSWVSQLIKNIEYFNEDSFEIELGEETIYIPLPGEDEGESYNIDDFLDFAWEMSGFKIIDNGRIQTTSKSYQIIKAESEDLEYYLKNTSEFYQEINGIELRIVEAPIVIAIACTELGSYHEDFGTYYENYLTIEIQYEDKREKLTEVEETELIYSYLFEIADSTSLIFHLSKIRENDLELEEKIEEIIYSEGTISENKKVDEEYILKPLLSFSESMKLYVSALQTNDRELRLLNFYKILEYYAPIVINIDAYELLAKKLDSPKVLKPNRKYLKSIFDLINSTNQRLRDSELIKSVFNTCFDIVDTFDYLPDSIKTKVLGTIKEKELNYETKNEKISQVANMVATILYSTRNQVVHAKSNFEPTGNECLYKDIEQLNEFLKEITARTIRWYTKLSDIQK